MFEDAIKENGRLKRTIALSLGDNDQSDTANISFHLMAAKDIASINLPAILGKAPAPGIHDAETTKYAQIEFASSDFLWRYSPQTNADILRPWLALVVGLADQFHFSGDLVTIDGDVLDKHNLTNSYLWAHVQSTESTNDVRCRLLSPAVLEPQKSYVAVLVPAFDKNGEDAWIRTNGGDTHKVFLSWRFGTATEGDFETLARKLHVPKPRQIGRAEMTYPREVEVVVNGAAIKPVLGIRGAISSLQPDLGRIKPEDPTQMTDKAITDALTSLGIADTSQTPDKRRARLINECQPVRDQIAAIRKDLDGLNNDVKDTMGPRGQPARELISLPHFGRPWLANPDEVKNGWPEALNDDVRYRGIAGLGVSMAIAGQEELMKAAVEQAGALHQASRRIGNLALGLFASEGLWQRRMPTDPMERLRIYGPMLARLPARGGSSVLDHISGVDKTMGAAWFSSAAQRLMRNRASHTRYVDAGNFDISKVLNAANSCDKPLVDPCDLARKILGNTPDDFNSALRNACKIMQHIHANLVDCLDHSEEYMQKEDKTILENLADTPIKQIRDIITKCPEAYKSRQSIDTFFENLASRYSYSPNYKDWSKIAPRVVGRAISNKNDRSQFELNFMRQVWDCMMGGYCKELSLPTEFLHSISGLFDNEPCLAKLRYREQICQALFEACMPRRGRKQPDLKRLVEILDNSFDPRKTTAPARLRVESTISGLPTPLKLTPPEFPIGLDFPTWELLNRYSRDWLLPGAGDLEEDSITALQTNPAFIDAFMVGINTQFLNEMRWRGLPVDRSCTPLRMFWGQVDHATGNRVADIEPLSEWIKDVNKDIGDLAHQSIKPAEPANQTGSRLVIAICSKIFERYPKTLIYLRSRVDNPENQDPDPNDALLKEAPNFGTGNYLGTIFMCAVGSNSKGAPITVFGFDLSPENLDNYWLILEEPPSDVRFRNDTKSSTTNSADFAAATLDRPTRVAIDGKYLKSQGL